MAADELRFHVQLDDCLVDCGFCAAHIGNDAVFVQEGADCTEIFRIIGDGCAENDQVAGGKLLIDSVKNDVHVAVGFCGFQCASCSGVGHDGCIWMNLFYFSGDGTADQSQTDECNCLKHNFPRFRGLKSEIILYQNDRFVNRLF